MQKSFKKSHIFVSAMLAIALLLQPFSRLVVANDLDTGYESDEIIEVEKTPDVNESENLPGINEESGAPSVLDDADEVNRDQEEIFAEIYDLLQIFLMLQGDVDYLYWILGLDYTEVEPGVYLFEPSEEYDYRTFQLTTAQIEEGWNIIEEFDALAPIVSNIVEDLDEEDITPEEALKLLTEAMMPVVSDLVSRIEALSTAMGGVEVEIGPSSPEDDEETFEYWLNAAHALLLTSEEIAVVRQLVNNFSSHPFVEDHLANLYELHHVATLDLNDILADVEGELVSLQEGADAVFALVLALEEAEMAIMTQHLRNVVTLNTPITDNLTEYLRTDVTYTLAVWIWDTMFREHGTDGQIIYQSPSDVFSVIDSNGHVWSFSISNLREMQSLLREAEGVFSSNYRVYENFILGNVTVENTSTNLVTNTEELHAINLRLSTLLGLGNDDPSPDGQTPPADQAPPSDQTPPPSGGGSSLPQAGAVVGSTALIGIAVAGLGSMIAKAKKKSV